MIRYLNNREIDRKKWDACIKDSFNGIVYASSWYLDIVSEEWEALIENDYERVFPLIPGKKWSISYLYQPVFTQQLGVFSKSILTEDVVKNFINSIPDKFKFAEINLNILNKINSDKIKIYNWLNHELDLINSYENISKSYSTNLKRNIKKGEKSGITITQNIKPDEVIRIFRENRGKKIKKLIDEDYHKLRRLSYVGIYKGLIRIYGAFTKNNELCAGAIFLKSKNKMIFLFSGLTEEGRKTNALALLIDTFIKNHSQQHLTLDFEGSNDFNLARFYKSFGS
ncbi:MAG: hypothetical protein K8R68_06850, partial [Bacteroidales bacterium]|nr:hypothetical protein [Bacteroidales bacterium]